MFEWVTAAAGLFGLLAGNLLTRSMEYRKWLRAERHKACAALLSASQAAMSMAAYRKSVSEAVSEGLEDPFRKFADLMTSRRTGWIVRLVARQATKSLVRNLSPDATRDEVSQGVSGVIESVTARAQRPTLDFVTERLEAGPNGRVTQLREVAQQLSLALESVDLICPDNVAAAGGKLFDAALSLAEGDVESSEWDKRLAVYKEARGSFVVAARRDLVRARTLRRKAL